MEVETVPLRRGIAERTRQLLATASADLVILQRKLLSVVQIGILRSAARRIVFDLDDALFHRDRNQEGRFVRWKLASRFWATMRAADVVVVGNEYLKRRAQEHIDLDRVHVVPTCVDPRRYPLARHDAAGGGARLAWIGQACTLQGMTGAGACLSAAGRAVPGLTLRLICDTKVDVDALNVELCPWSATTEADDLGAADIGISWLADIPFNRGKCGLKVLQYMAAGLPVVGNPIGITPELVIHGKTGFLASTPEEWAEAIKRLAENPELRRQMGAAGRKVVEERYSVGAWSRRFAGLIHDTAAGTGVHGGPALVYARLSHDAEIPPRPSNWLPREAILRLCLRPISPDRHNRDEPQRSIRPRV
jgi:glycosyltransferase involved in cell wall biosynthesis